MCSMATRTAYAAEHNVVGEAIVAANLDPIITGGGTAAISVPENQTAVTTVMATDPDMPSGTLAYSLSGGADRTAFLINGSSGLLSFVTPPDFENASDLDVNNIYNVIVQVADGQGGQATQAIAVTVTDVGDSQDSSGGAHSSLANDHINLATQIGAVPTTGEMAAQHNIINQNIVDVLAALQADLTTLQATVDALSAGAGPCEVPPVWGKTYATAERFVSVLGGAAFCDKATGLVWDGTPSITIKTDWRIAIQHCAFRTVGGQKGFHLPTIEQLASLADLTAMDLNGDGPFTGVQSALYWSATTFVSNPKFARMVSFINGNVVNDHKDDGRRSAWCVRGGQAIDGNMHNTLH